MARGPSASRTGTNKCTSTCRVEGRMSTALHTPIRTDDLFTAKTFARRSLPQYASEKNFSRDHDDAVRTEVANTPGRKEKN